MNLFEYMGKELFRESGIPVPRGRIAETPQEAVRILPEVGGHAVVKAQVLSGGRGKAGGVKFADSAEEMEKAAEAILSSKLKDLNVPCVLVEEKVDIQRELYLSIMMDNENRDNILVMSGQGGVEIESNADNISRFSIGSEFYIERYHLRNILYKQEVPVEYTDQIFDIVQNMIALYKTYHATLVEINPLVITGNGEVVACDAKVSIDNNIVPYNEKIQQLICSRPDDYSSEYFKLENGFDYLELDPEGDVGLISTGAGLTMAVVDKLNDEKIKTVNFIDIRTGGFRGSTQRLEVALSKMVAYPTVKVLLVNIFGGITDLNEFATLLIEALKKQNIKLPMVIRLEGNNFEMANETLKSCGFEAVNSLDVAVKQAAAIIGGAN